MGSRCTAKFLLLMLYFLLNRYRSHEMCNFHLWGLPAFKHQSVFVLHYHMQWSHWLYAVAQLHRYVESNQIIRLLATEMRALHHAWVPISFLGLQRTVNINHCLGVRAKCESWDMSVLSCELKSLDENAEQRHLSRVLSWAPLWIWLAVAPVHDSAECY